MTNLYMKITGFDDSSNSLLVAFASDATQSQNPEDYASLAFQPANMWPDVTDTNEIKKRLAVAGVWHVEQQARKEMLDQNPTQLNGLKALVGVESTFVISELIPPPSDFINLDTNITVVV